MTWLTAIPGALKLVPRWVWYALLAAFAWHLALSWHAGKVKAHDAAIVAAHDAQWQVRLAAERDHALAVARNAEQTAAKINAKLKDSHNAQVRHNAADADDLLLRGPGAAASAAHCRPVDRPGFSAGAGQPRGGGDAGGAAASSLHPADGLSGLPASDFAVVPWSWLVDFARQADDSRAEVLTWRDWYDRQAAAWDKMRAQK
jgi:hypothetical protein